MKMGDKPGTELATAREYAQAVTEFFEKKDEAVVARIAGSVRREEPVVGDIDIVVATNEPEALSQAIEDEGMFTTLQRGPSKVSVGYDEHGVQVDIHLAEPSEFGAALLYLTGSAEHNIALRHRAKKKGMKLNEYGLWDRDTDELIASQTEELIYDNLGLAWVPPRNRDDTLHVSEPEAEPETEEV